MIRVSCFGAVSVGVAVLLVASGFAQTKSDFSAAALSALPPRGWPTNGGNLHNQR